MKLNLQKKISVAKVCGKVTGSRVAKAGGNLKMATFAGIASDIKSGVSDFGEWEALTGQFRAINAETGEVFDSGVCFLPDVALDLVKGQLASGAKAVEFAFEISAVEDETVSVGYSYRASPLLEMAEDDPMQRLMVKVPTFAPALSAPVADEKAQAKGKK